MRQHLLPPRGIFIPTQMIFHSQLSSAVILTWIRLRCLAWDGWSAPPLSIPELASLLGIHPARLSRHLFHLQEISSLSWQTTVNGKIILSFPEEPTIMAENHVNTQIHTSSTMISSMDREVPGSHSYFPHQIMGYLTNQDDQEEVLDINDSEDAKYTRNEVENCYASA